MKEIHYHLKIKTANQVAVPEKDQFNDDDVIDKITEDLLEFETRLNQKYIGKARVHSNEF
ncbi:MAG TPA: hypothetical protein ENH90_01895 [bacterium]|nr:hypothetical protein [bacterium]